MKRSFAYVFAAAILGSLLACGGTSEEVYDGNFTINGARYHCTNQEAGDLCQKGNCSKCDKL